MQSNTAARRRFRGIALPALALLLLAAALPARAQIGSERYAAIVTDAETGNALYAASPDELRHPASLTKMMTLYMTFEALREGRLQLGAAIPVSENAAEMPPSRIGLLPGMHLSVEEAILALVTKSANDAAAALGEYLGNGSEDRFAQMMTLKARSIGMSRTVFRNASGLPDAEQVSTARDMALLGRRLMRDFPDRFAYFSTPYFRFRGRVAFNHNRLLQEYDGTDGIKTGYVNDSGFNLVASARREGVRLVAAVFGGRTGRERDRHMMALLDQGFTQMGVTARPQAVAARRALPQMVPGAQAHALGAGAAHVARLNHGPATAALPLPPGRGPAMRLATSKPPRAANRVEQGDTDRSVLRAPPHRSSHLRVAAPPKPAKPGKSLRS
jgi:D-alanyl-D-alanine carboxypeptidase